MAITLTFRGLSPFGNTPIIPPTGTVGFKNDTTASTIIMDYVGVLSGSYAQHGDTCDFTLGGTLEFPIGEWAPTKVEIEEIVAVGAVATGFKFIYLWSTTTGPTSTSFTGPTQAGGAIQILGTGAGSGQGMTELASGAYSGTTPALNATVLGIRAYFVKS